ncbi:DUF4307 domain-containing protein [Microbacterium rhizomatis]|uniref:DUF4307 domain-containing protein n=1 Tax=Microbacterium rhizomatis TaxID=1631477 RepID=A0A5J5IX74_9MICO|nr:DUF4307 domain-containing protein [Microbacterium rhizomatis]KAA9105676.1 DUF4307 domain-containing protein [Microbacterium rhizomatis]
MTTPDRLDVRYGRVPSPGRRWALVIVIGAIAVAAAAFAWLTISNALDDVGVDTTGYSIDGEHSVTLSFQISAAAGKNVACALEAQDEEHGVVGWKIVQYDASEVHARAFRETIPTVGLATTGFVNTCWVT